ncbi:MAG: toxic anion resistance protein [Candidatus Xenobia bacterium]
MIATVNSATPTRGASPASPVNPAGGPAASQEVPQDLFTASSAPAAAATAKATAPAEQPNTAQTMVAGAGAAMGLNSPAVATALDQLAALGSENTLQQQTPAEVQVQTGARIKVDPEQAKAAAQQVDKLVSELVHLDPDSAEFKSKIDAIQSMGRGDIDRSANVSRGILNQSLHTMKRGELGAGVSNQLGNLRSQLDALNPDRAVGKMSRIPIIGHFARGIEKYARECQSAQTNIEAIDKALQTGRQQLVSDNGELEAEITGLRDLTKKVTLYAYATRLLDDSLGQEIEKMKATDPEKAQRFQNDCHFYVRQKHQDLMTQLAVNLQGELVLGTIRKNNEELIKGVDRARTTTMSAFRTGVIAAITLDRQKRVLEGVNALNETTGNLIEATGRQLNEQGKSIREQASKAVIDPEKINAAFQSIFQCLDEIDTFKGQAMDEMAKTIDVLGSQLDVAREKAERLKTEQQNDSHTQQLINF